MAQLDPSIILGSKPMQIESPVNQLAKVLQIQEMQQSGRARDMQMTDMQDARDKRNRLAALLQGGNVTPETLMKGGFIDEAQAMQKSQLDAKKAGVDMGKTEAETHKIKLANAIDQMEAVSQVMSTVKDQATYDMARQTAQANGWDVSKMPPQYDPVMIEQKRLEGMKVKDQLDQVWKAKGYDLDVRKQGETERNNRTQNAISQGNLNVSRGNLALSGQRLAFDKAQPKGVISETADGPMLVDPRTGQARPVIGPSGSQIGPKPSEAQKKEMLSINQQRSVINGAMDAVKKTPSAFSFGRGLAAKMPFGESLAGRSESADETKARAYVFNNVSKVITERAGAAQSAQELARLQAFLPSDTDQAEQITNKLDGFNQYLNDLESGTIGKKSAPVPSGGKYKILSVEE